MARLARCHMHFILTCSIWVNQAERWFGLITQKGNLSGIIRERVRQLIFNIQRNVDQYNLHKPQKPCERPPIPSAKKSGVYAQLFDR
ncbi:hypothetical protein SAMN06265784_108226 [Paraburkholderia susongensis]|uniref:Transposase n=2 Tax=Paraburkholderia susongensis TaxID=1515439 RepID=A0A1X7LRY0_9BURK|nr:hypothetical protein SAMN06265784_108226 [Paraburkholderia susongensis]